MMQAIRTTDSSTKKCTPNVVPCRIHHTGPTKITKRYWTPSKDGDGTRTVYLRGRKLRGRAVKIPNGYQGMVLKTTTRTLPQPIPRKTVRLYNSAEEEDYLDDEGPNDLSEPVKVFDKTAKFNEIVVWDHDRVPDSDDPFVRNIEEWIAFAEAIHGEPRPTNGNENDRHENSTTNT